MKDATSAWFRVLSCSLTLSLVVGCDAEVSEPQQVPDSTSGFATSDVARSDGGVAPSADAGGGPTSDGGGSGGCETDEDCVDQVAIGPCQAVSCAPATGLCSVMPVPDSTPCGEDDLCLSAGACAQGLCIGQPAKCDDGNPCTDGSCKPDRGCVYLDNTAPCDDADLCTTGDTCTGGKCVGTLISGCGGGCGDGSCADGEDCTSCAADCGPCSTSGCADYEVANCEGGCSPTTMVGDGTCDLELDCAATGNDGGDCAQVGTCGDSQVEGCGGVCLDPLAFAQMLANTTCDAELNCSTYDYDAGSCTTGSGCEASDFPCADGDGCISTLLVCDGSPDCGDGSDEANCVAPGTCPEGKAPGCNDICYTASWFGDGVCDLFLDCEATSWDGGDCEQTTGGGGSTTECDAGEQVVCAGTYCLPSTWLGDGTCDAPMDCAETGWDGGDCESTTGGGGSGGGDLECPADKQPNCSGTYCYTSAWIGDGTCDSFFDCSSTGWDGGDCL